MTGRTCSRDEYKAWAQVKPLGDVPESTDIAADLLEADGLPQPRLAPLDLGAI